MALKLFAFVVKLAKMLNNFVDTSPGQFLSADYPKLLLKSRIALDAYMNTMSQVETKDKFYHCLELNLEPFACQANC